MARIADEIAIQLHAKVVTETVPNPEISRVGRPKLVFTVYFNEVRAGRLRESGVGRVKNACANSQADVRAFYGLRMGRKRHRQARRCSKNQTEFQHSLLFY